jgi:hypothetical protein
MAAKFGRVPTNGVPEFFARQPRVIALDFRDQRSTASQIAPTKIINPHLVRVAVAS